MKVECSKCNSNYNVNDSKVPASGAKIKCPKCQNPIVISNPQIAPPALPSQKVAETVGSNQGPSLYNNGSEKKNCLFCAEEILAVATKCKHCGADLVESQQKSNSNEKAMVIKKERSIAPMILGIIDGIIGLPGAVCAGACEWVLGQSQARMMRRCRQWEIFIYTLV